MVDAGLYDFEVLTDNDKEKRAVDSIISKFEELNFIADNGWKVLVVRNRKKNIKEEDLQNGNFTAVTISKISPKMEDVLAQLSGNNYSFMLEIVESAFSEGGDTPCLDFNQMKGLMYFELCKITPDKKLRKASSNDWLKIIHGLGKNFDRIDSSCTDILSENFDWEGVMGSYFSQLGAE